jgi:hypothetical protein
MERLLAAQGKVTASDPSLPWKPNVDEWQILLRRKSWCEDLGFGFSGDINTSEGLPHHSTNIGTFSTLFQ